MLTAQGTDEEEAAALMGAGGFRIFTQVTFPPYQMGIPVRYRALYRKSDGENLEQYLFYPGI